MELLKIAKDVIKRKLIDLGRRSGRLKTPMDMVILDLQVHQLLPKKLIALELFGMHGLWITVDYAHLCDYLELWEIDPYFANFARKFLAKAAVKIGDSIEAVKKGNLLRNDYNFVVIDNPISGTFGSGNYCEHFDLFPALFERIAGKSVLIMNTVIDMEKIASMYPSLSLADWLIRRKLFYGYGIEVTKIEVNALLDIYRNKFDGWRINVENMLFVPRNTAVGFLIATVSRR